MISSNIFGRTVLSQKLRPNTCSVFTAWDGPKQPSVRDLLLLIGGGGDGAVRVNHCLGTADDGNDQEKAEEEQEEEGKSQIHIDL